MSYNDQYMNDKNSIYKSTSDKLIANSTNTLTNEVADSLGEINDLIQQLEVCLGYNGTNTNTTCKAGISSSDIYQDIKYRMDIQSTRYPPTLSYINCKTNANIIIKNNASLC